jgi:uncharacterized membrane protein
LIVEYLRECLYIFGMSMIPVIELRGAIPLGFGLGLPWYISFMVSVVGNFVPVPFILLFIRKILLWMKKIPKLHKVALWLEKKAEHKSVNVMKYASAGLAVFVAIPLPGTGAWTGALVAAMLNMRMKYALPSIFAGVVAAGFIVTGVVYGFLGVLSFLVM